MFNFLCNLPPIGNLLMSIDQNLLVNKQLSGDKLNFKFTEFIVVIVAFFVPFFSSQKTFIPSGTN